MRTETLIIGGGLSGLSLASSLAAKGRSFCLLEARDRVGGRILTEGADGACFDLGPAWFWPGQPRIAAEIERLGLRVFEQYSAGELSFEDEFGHVQRGRGHASMQGSYRLDGGLAALTEAIAAKLPKDKLILSNRVTRLQRNGGPITVETDQGLTITADQVVLAMPPRVAANLDFNPTLDARAVTAMNAIPTWMAGQAKAVAVYEHPFWREAGLSGDAMSRRGPMVEIHDASTCANDHHALFGFIGVPPQARTDDRALREQIVAQLTRLFGPDAAAPIALHVKDWAHDPLTATGLDQQPLYAHPSYGLPHALDRLWDGRLIFAGTEVAPQFGGYLEGALEAAENAVALLEHVKA